MKHYAGDLIEYVIFNNMGNLGVGVKEISSISGIPIKTVRNWMPKLEAKGKITHANVGKPYRKMYYVKRNHLNFFKTAMKPGTEPLDVSVSEGTRVRIRIGDNLVEYDPEKKELTMNSHLMIKKGSEARFLATKMHRKRREEKEKGIETMKVREEFVLELEKKHVEMEYESAGEEVEDDFSFKGNFE